MAIESRPGEASAVVVTADWDDLDAGVIVGSQAIHAAIASKSDDGPTRRKFVLKLFDGEPAWLTAERAAPPPAGSDGSEPPVAVTLKTQVGRFGDAAQERRLLEAIARRLGQLRGVEFAPIQ